MGSGFLYRDQALFLQILGIDPGSVRTGYAVVERSGSSLRALDYGTISLGSGRMENRLKCLFEELNRITDQHEPSQAVIGGDAGAIGDQ